MSRKPIYRIGGWSKRIGGGLSACNFSILLDGRFAEAARSTEFEHQDKFQENIRRLIGYEHAGVMFLRDTFFFVPCR
jgi:hypothetical protein